MPVGQRGEVKTALLSFLRWKRYQFIDILMGRTQWGGDTDHGREKGKAC